MAKLGGESSGGCLLVTSERFQEKERTKHLFDLVTSGSQERQEAEKMFKGKRGAQLAKDIARRTKTFTPGVAAQLEKKRTGPSQADVDAIKNAIANASSLAEVERLKGMLQAGQIPGRDLRQGQGGMVEEEEGDTAQMEAHMGGGAGEEMNEGEKMEDDEDMDVEPHVNGP